MPVPPPFRNMQTPPCCSSSQKPPCGRCEAGSACSVDPCPALKPAAPVATCVCWRFALSTNKEGSNHKTPCKLLEGDSRQPAKCTRCWEGTEQAHGVDMVWFGMVLLSSERRESNRQPGATIREPRVHAGCATDLAGASNWRHTLGTPPAGRRAGRQASRQAERRSHTHGC